MPFFISLTPFFVFLALILVQIEKLLQAIEKNPFATQAYYAEQIGVSKRTVSRIFVSLQQNGVLVQNGTNRKSNWVIIK